MTYPYVTYRYEDKDGEHTITADWIRSTYYEEWYERMVRAHGKETMESNLFTFDDCIQHFLTDVGGWEVQPDYVYKGD